jgi:hypothetical protein
VNQLQAARDLTRAASTGDLVMTNGEMYPLDNIAHVHAEPVGEILDLVVDGRGHRLGERDVLVKPSGVDDATSAVAESSVATAQPSNVSARALAEFGSA